MDEQLVKELEQALIQFFNPDTDNETKAAIEAGLLKIRQRADILVLCNGILERSTNQYVLWFACSTLESIVRENWSMIGDLEAKRLRELIMNFLQARFSQLPMFVSSKITKVLVDIGKADWPHRYPNFMAEVKALCTEQNSSVLGLNLLLVASEEFVADRPGSKILSKRKEEMKNLLKLELPGITSLLLSVLTTELNLQRQKLIRSTRCKLAFDTLIQIISWAPLKDCVSPELMHVLFEYVLLLESPYTVKALSCVNEIMEKNYVPNDLQGFIAHTAAKALEILDNVCALERSKLELLEDFILQFNHFLVILLRRHLRRLENHQSFRISSLLEVLYKYTFLQVEAEGMLACIEVWDVFIRYVEENGTGPGNQIVSPSVYLNGLSKLMIELLPRILWCKNAESLDLIDDEISEGLTDRSKDQNEPTSVGRSNTADGETPYQHFILTMVDFIVRIAVLPNPTAAPALQPLLETVTRSLNEQMSLLNNPERNIVVYAAKDCSTLFMIAGRVIPSLQLSPNTFEGVKQVISWSLDIVSRSNKNRLYTQGSHFVELQKSCLRFLRYLSGWFVSVKYHVSHQSQTNAVDCISKEFLSSSVSEIVSNCLDSLTSPISPPPKLLMLAAIEAFESYGSVVQPENFHDLPPVRNLCANLHSVGAAVPMDVKCCLLVAVSKSIIEPLKNLPMDSSTWQRAQPVYVALLAKDSSELISMSQEIDKSPGSITLSGGRSRSNFVALTALTKSVSGTSKRLKQFVSPVVVPAVEPSMNLFVAFIQATQSEAGNQRVASTCLGSARDCLDFLIQVFEVMVKEIDRDLAVTIMEKLVAVTSVPNSVATLLGFGKGGMMVVLKLMKLFGTIVTSPSASFLVSESSNVKIGVLQMSFDTLTQAISAGATSASQILDLRDIHYKLVFQILVSKWKWFLKPISRNQVIEFQTDQAKQYFVKAMEIFITSFQDATLPPATYRYNLSVFNDLQKTHNLYTIPLFRTEMLNAFVLTLMDAMTDGSRQILQDEIVFTVYNLASVDFENFFVQIIPAFLAKRQLSAQHVVFDPVTDAPAFSNSLKGFINDVKVVN